MTATDLITALKLTTQVLRHIEGAAVDINVNRRSIHQSARNAIADAEAVLAQATPLEPTAGWVAIPVNADQAAGMVLVAEAWLQQHAPERLRVTAAPTQAVTDIVALLGRVDALRAVAIGSVQHVYRGDCTEPDRPDAFDPECPACVAIRGAAPAQAESQVPVARPSPTAGMNIAQRILHVGGRNNEAGYVEFGSIQAVEALIRQVLRDMPAAPAQVTQAEHAAAIRQIQEAFEADDVAAGQEGGAV